MPVVRLIGEAWKWQANVIVAIDLNKKVSMANPKFKEKLSVNMAHYEVFKVEGQGKKAAPREKLDPKRTFQEQGVAGGDAIWVAKKGTLPASPSGSTATAVSPKSAASPAGTPAKALSPPPTPKQSAAPPETTKPAPEITTTAPVPPSLDETPQQTPPVKEEPAHADTQPQIVDASLGATTTEKPPPQHQQQQQPQEDVQDATATTTKPPTESAPIAFQKEPSLTGPAILSALPARPPPPVEPVEPVSLPRKDPPPAKEADHAVLKTEELEGLNQELDEMTRLRQAEDEKTAVEKEKRQREHVEAQKVLSDLQTRDAQLASKNAAELSKKSEETARHELEAERKRFDEERERLETELRRFKNEESERKAESKQEKGLSLRELEVERVELRRRHLQIELERLENEARQVQQRTQGHASLYAYTPPRQPSQRPTTIDPQIYSPEQGPASGESTAEYRKRVQRMALHRLELEVQEEVIARDITAAEKRRELLLRQKSQASHIPADPWWAEEGQAHGRHTENSRRKMSPKALHQNQEDGPLSVPRRAQSPTPSTPGRKWSISDRRRREAALRRSTGHQAVSPVLARTASPPSVQKATEADGRAEDAVNKVCKLVQHEIERDRAVALTAQERVVEALREMRSVKQELEKWRETLRAGPSASPRQEPAAEAIDATTSSLEKTEVQRNTTELASSRPITGLAANVPADLREYGVELMELMAEKAERERQRGYQSQLLAHSFSSTPTRPSQEPAEEELQPPEVESPFDVNNRRSRMKALRKIKQEELGPPEHPTGHRPTRASHTGAHDWHPSPGYIHGHDARAASNLPQAEGAPVWSEALDWQMGARGPIHPVVGFHGLPGEAAGYGDGRQRSMNSSLPLRYGQDTGYRTGHAEEWQQASYADGSRESQKRKMLGNQGHEQLPPGCAIVGDAQVVMPLGMARALLSGQQNQVVGTRPRTGTGPATGTYPTQIARQRQGIFSSPSASPSPGRSYGAMPESTFPMSPEPVPAQPWAGSSPAMPTLGGALHDYANAYAHSPPRQSPPTHYNTGEISPSYHSPDLISAASLASPQASPQSPIRSRDAIRQAKQLLDYYR
ncbi:hypothetical protein DIPPA_04054 [Diplonema papillatum]|nr:hypothetical protein DIPPA_04054 [Diplonema papillatum]